MRLIHNLRTKETREVELTQEEIDAALRAKAEEDAFNHPDLVAERDVTNNFAGSTIARLLFDINFNQENRIRALEGKPAITKTQYRDALLARYKTLMETK